MNVIMLYVIDMTWTLLLLLLVLTFDTCHTQVMVHCEALWPLLPVPVKVRGYVGSPMLGEMALEDAVGKGAIQIVKNHPDWPRPYNGITAIRHGDIDRDIGTHH